MLKDLIISKEKLESYLYKKSAISILKNNDLKTREIISSSFDSNIILYKYINWLLKNNNYYICLYKDNRNYTYFELINKNLLLIAQISLSINNDFSFYPKNKLILELYSIVSLKKGEGSLFIKNLISLKNILNVPIVLYCDYSLISYYKSFGFIPKYTNYQNYMLMIYE